MEYATSRGLEIICIVQQISVTYTLIHTIFFFNATATTEIYTLSYTTLFRSQAVRRGHRGPGDVGEERRTLARDGAGGGRSEEHTSELQSQSNLVCRLLLEKKNNQPVSPAHRLRR